MPTKKKVVKKKKGKKAATVEVFPIPRDRAEPAPLDGYDGALGLEHLELQERVRAVHSELVQWKISECTRLGELDLELCELEVDELPEEVFDLQWLQVIDLSKNLFGSEVFQDLVELRGLRAINLDYNLLSGHLPAIVADLPPQIEELSFDYNVLTEIPEAAAVLTELKWLSCRRNLLAGISTSCFAAWTQLEHLDLRDNKFKIVPPEISSCLQLQTLLLSNNGITELPDTLGFCTGLIILQVQKNALKSLPESLAKCADLEELDASFNKIAEYPPALCVYHTRMKRLMLCENKLSVLPPEVRCMEGLEVLGISNNSIKALPEEVGALSHLREVYCNGNPMTSLPASIAGWVAVEEAGFKGCKLKGLPGDVAGAWKACKVLDVRFPPKKKDGCKVTTEFRDAMEPTRMLGIVVSKKKKAKGSKKKKA